MIKKHLKNLNLFPWTLKFKIFLFLAVYEKRQDLMQNKDLLVGV